ncbi:MAG: tetratricopeptide repeat protein [Chloroflexi bacterium]|nr:tetratricopeptide repeat protein [Chloroflexota bacterium]
MSNDLAQFQNLMSRGHAAAWDQDWDIAADLYQQALLETPDHPLALASLGLANFQLKKYDEALRLYQQCSAITPNDPMPFEKIARIYEKVGMQHESVQSFMQAGETQLKARDVERAITNFKEAIRLEPKNQTVHTRLAMIFDKLGQIDESITEYMITAAIMQSLGDITKAIQVVQYASQMSPNHPETSKALELLKKGRQIPIPDIPNVGSEPGLHSQIHEEKLKVDSSEATPRYDPITETHLNALKQMAGLLFEQSEEAKQNGQSNWRGINLLNRGTDGLSPEQANRTRIQMHLSQTIDLQTAGQDEQAAVELERAIDLGLNQSASFYVLGLLLQYRSSQKALKHLQKSAKNPDYALASFLIMADINERSGHLKEASANYLQALRLADSKTVSPQDTEELDQLYEPIFESHLKIVDEKTLQALCSVISGQLMRSDWREFLLEARKQLPQQGDGSPPLPLAEILLETTNNQVVEALANVKHLASEGKTRAAMEEAFHALSYAPSYLPLHIQIGELLISEGRTQDATDKFMVVANLYMVRGETTRAIRLLQRVAILAPMDLAVRTLLIDLLKSIDRTGDAIEQYVDLANVYYLLAELEMARQTYQAALELSQQKSSMRSWSIQILNKLADIELQSLDWRSAIKLFEQLRTLEPLEPGPRSTLIDLYMRIELPAAAMNELDAFLNLINGPETLSTGKQFLDDLLSERPDNIDIQKRMITFYSSQDNNAEVIDKLDALAEKCLQQENSEGALATLQQLISLNPTNVAEYQKLYDDLKGKNLIKKNE